MNDIIFKQQIKEDIKLIQEKIAWDNNILKDEYAFNYWVLSNLYNLDEENCSNYITEYNDKGIDCFVHYEEEKELYIIQNKFYDENTQLNSKEVSDFLTRPLSSLNKNEYSRSPDLQKIYNLAKDDVDYKVFLHFYISNENIGSDCLNIVNNFNEDGIFAELFTLNSIHDKYYGESYTEEAKLNISLTVKNRGTYLAIRPDEYQLPNMSEAYYVMAKIVDVFKVCTTAEKQKYPLFEENIREYLGGTSGINKKIISTLKDPKERGNFFYYNNGITIICDSAKADSSKIQITQPQIVNGCQTVNSIVEALKNNTQMLDDFNDVYVMVKVLVVNQKETSFYRDIVRYTNSQNSINEKVFGATLKPFSKIQEKLKDYGILICVKQSDKFQFKKHYSDKKSLGKILLKANSFSNDFYLFNKLTELQMPLETLLQIIGAFIHDAHFAYTKKSSLLKPTSKEYYQEFSVKIADKLTFECMAKLIIIYKRAEQDKKSSADKRSPSAYYLLNFLGYYLKNQETDLHEFLKSTPMEDFQFIYEKLNSLPNKYIKNYNEKYTSEYNNTIKQQIDETLMDQILIDHLESMQEHNSEHYTKLMKILTKKDN